MVSPDKVQSEAKKRENENFKFRTYLKGHLGFLDTVSVCPVAFEIFERLKQEYGFEAYR